MANQLPVQHAAGIPYVLVQSVEDLQQCVRQLRQLTAAGVAVDLEGLDLGRQGRVGTLQLCASSKGVVYIIDIAELGDSAFDPEHGLRQLLESTDVKKYFFDARADCNALHYLHQVDIPADSIIDIQLYDTAAGLLNGRSLDKYGGLGYLLEKTNYAGMSMAERRRMAVVKDRVKTLCSSAYGGSYAVWLERPLSALLLEYATDCRFFHALAHYFQGVVQQKGGARAVQAIKDATTRRIEEALSYSYSSSNREANISVDRILASAIRQAATSSSSSSSYYDHEGGVWGRDHYEDDSDDSY